MASLLSRQLTSLVDQISRTWTDSANLSSCSWSHQQSRRRRFPFLLVCSLFFIGTPHTSSGGFNWEWYGDDRNASCLSFLEFIRRIHIPVPFSVFQCVTFLISMSSLYEILSTLSHYRILSPLVITPCFCYKSDRYGDGFGKRKFSAEEVSQEAAFISSCSVAQMCSLEDALGLSFYFLRAVDPVGLHARIFQ